MSTPAFAVKLVFNKLPQLEARVHAAVAAVVESAAHEVEGRAKLLCPVDTGFLRASIGPAFKDSDLLWYVHVFADYGIYVEFGTTGHHAQPFLSPAVALARDRFNAGVAAALRSPV